MPPSVSEHMAYHLADMMLPLQLLGMLNHLRP